MGFSVVDSSVLIILVEYSALFQVSWKWRKHLRKKRYKQTLLSYIFKSAKKITGRKNDLLGKIELKCICGNCITHKMHDYVNEGELSCTQQ